MIVGPPFGFGLALRLLEAGNAVARTGWIGGYPMWIVLEDGRFIRHYIGTLGHRSYVWLPTCAEDLRTVDWHIVDRSKYGKPSTNR